MTILTAQGTSSYSKKGSRSNRTKSQPTYMPVTPTSSPEAHRYSNASEIEFPPLGMMNPHQQQNNPFFYPDSVWYDPMLDRIIPTHIFPNGFCPARAQFPQFVPHHFPRKHGKKNGSGNITPPHCSKQRRFDYFNHNYPHSAGSSPHSYTGTVFFGSPNESTSYRNGRNLDGMSKAETIKLVKKELKMSEEQLRRNGYPTFESENRVIVPATFYDKGTMGWIDESDKTRKCSRCNSEFMVNENGSYPKTSCLFKNGGLIQVCDTHVSTQFLSSAIHEFVTAPAPEGNDDPRSEEMYSLDCEMVYTVEGFAVGRVSMVDYSGKAVFDVLVKPSCEILDFNTEYSGLTKDMLENATDTLETCREKMFKLINSETILIGHGLESDLKCLRLVHRNVVDTSILFREEKTKKISLRKLSSSLLNVLIQQDKPKSYGHCSIEDSLACMNLVKYKLQTCRV